MRVIQRRFSAPIELFEKISKSSYGRLLLHGIAGLIIALIFPVNSLGWIYLNIVIYQFISILTIALHEIGHAIATVCVGMKVATIVVGTGNTILERWLFGISWQLKAVPQGGMTYISEKSTYFYRLRSFTISLFGPLTNFLLLYVTLQFPRELILTHPPGFYIFPGLIFCITNTLAVISALLHTIAIWTECAHLLMGYEC